MPRPSLPPDLAELDEMLWRWAAERTVRGPAGLPRMSTLEKIRLLRDGAALGQTTAPTPREYFQLDEIIEQAPEDVRAMILTWYRDRCPVQTKAERLGIHRTTIYEHWKQALRYVQGAMRERGVAVVA